MIEEIERNGLEMQSFLIPNEMKVHFFDWYQAARCCTLVVGSSGLGGIGLPAIQR